MSETHDDLCEKIEVDIGVGNMYSPCSCLERNLRNQLSAAQKRIEELEGKLSAYKHAKREQILAK